MGEQTRQQLTKAEKFMMRGRARLRDNCPPLAAHTIEILRSDVSKLLTENDTLIAYIEALVLAADRMPGLALTSWSQAGTKHVECVVCHRHVETERRAELRHAKECFVGIFVVALAPFIALLKEEK